MTTRTAEYDALADLFLGDDASPPPAHQPLRPRQPPSGALTIEALVLGHLPVLASAWAMQYAREVSQRRAGWTGVISLRAGQVAVELVGAVGQGEPDTGKGLESLEEALAAGSRQTCHWLLRVEPPCEQAAALLGGVDQVTLLSGADEAAVVASYELLKQVHAKGGRSLRVAIMGSSAEQARDAVTRLSKASEAFLGHAVPMAACVPAIGPGRTITLYRGAMDEPAETVLRHALQCLRQRVPSLEARLESRKPAPAAPTPSHPAPAAASSHTPLSVLIPGLTGLRARCPFAPHIELAAASDGGLHLLAPHASAWNDHLSAAAAWAVEHLALLRLTPACESLRDTPPTLHVFTERPPELLRLLTSSIRVHALARAGSTWVAIDLN